MSTVTITRADATQLNDYNEVITPVITSDFRSYGNFAFYDRNSYNDPPTDTYDMSSGYFYFTGPEGVDSYEISNPLLDYYGGDDSVDIKYNIAVGHPDLGNFGEVETNDTIAGGIYADVIYGGPGNDSITSVTTNTANLEGNTFFGGSGNDSLIGQAQADKLYGDYADAPVFVNNEQWSVPTAAVSSVVDGNDTLVGNYGDDTLYGGGGDDVLLGGDSLDTLLGGDGNDQLNGGPRGQGWTDVLTGGSGADAFMLSYTSDASTVSAGNSFWGTWATNYVPGTADSAVEAGVNGLAKAAAKDFFEGIAGSVILGGLSTALGGVVAEGLSFLLGQNKSPTPQPTTEDVMVVTDFDPREDVLFLPLNTGSDAQTLTATPTNFAASASGQTGYGIKFSKGTSDTIFAEVFLDPDFIDDFGLTSNSAATLALIHDIFAQKLMINDSGYVDNEGNADSKRVYPFPTDASAYTDGSVPAVADTPVPFQAPSGTTTVVYGAFGPQIIVGPSVNSNNTYVAGTGMGDLVFVTSEGFAPDDWDNASVVSQVSNASVVKGYDGNDILNGSSGEDDISGGDGDDFIYGWNSAFSPLRDQLSGDDGNDTLFAAKPTGGRAAADFDGGDATDTVSFAYSRYGVVASLADGTGSNAGDADSGAYSFTDVENLTGTDLDDTLTGNAEANVLSGLGGNDTLTGDAGNDTISGGDGYDTVQFASGTKGGAYVDLAYNNGVELSGLWVDAYGGLDTVDRSSVEAYVGTPDDDQFKGDGGDGTYVLYSADFYGMDGDDSLTGSGLGETLDGGAGNDSLDGLSGNDTLTGGAGDDTIDGGAGNDTINWAVGDGSDTVNGGGDSDAIVVNLDNGISGKTQTATINVLGSQSVSIVVGSDTIAATELTNIVVDLDPDGSASDVTVNGSLSDNGLSLQTVAGAIGIDDAPATDGDDVIFGSNENDTLRGRMGNDIINARDGADVVLGEAGDDDLDGGNGPDALAGGPGDDQIDGQADDDWIDGGQGDDALNGGRGSDIVTGSDGSDVFRIAKGDGIDRITDFDIGTDLIAVTDGIDFDDLAFSGSDIALGDEILATLVGVETSTLTQSDFVWL